MPLWKRNLWVCWFGSFATGAGLSLVLPFLPLYIEMLGVHNVAAVEQWSGLAFGATFITAAIFSPLWGKLADRHGRKLMLLRASIGMAVIMILMGFAQNVYQLVGLRLLMGLVSGYISAATTLVATQTPYEHSGWALGTLSTGQVSGNLLGPLIGGWLSEVIGLRHVFFVTGGFLILAFLVTYLLIKEDFRPEQKLELGFKEVWSKIENPKAVMAMFLTTMMIQVAILTIEPIVTVYVKQLVQDVTHLALIAGFVVSIPGLANIFSASRLGRISDQKGPSKVLFFSLLLAALVFVPQAYVQTPWQLMGLRFILGIAMAGMLPAVNTLIRKSVPGSVSGRIFGYNQSAQYLGNVTGPLLGGQIAAYYGIRYVFLFTAALLVINALWVRHIDKMTLDPQKHVFSTP
ncbi:multidrug efflux MFS transporter [Desulfitobacterium sp.]|uniref:multidrug efflux MFS transporter n=1 Tax=Desulfitobacterium sp. TaxID=49981 RepID=UPI002B9F5952|nr:multidrug efflux MFS transporter [Desulfitobacterium sp.]HVJ50655.1 multidrug efflux MFS transporter [Desulfitobacterium sp.]